jgi:hypothetical protein
MSRFSIIIFHFFMQKFLETKKFFQKVLENFQPPPPPPPPPTERKKLKFPSRRRRRLPKSFLAAAATEKDIGLHL